MSSGAPSRTARASLARATRLPCARRTGQPSGRCRPIRVCGDAARQMGSALVALVAPCLAMAQAAEEFVVRPGSPHEASGGIVFSLEEGGHKHGEGGVATGRWALRFERGRVKGELSFSASGPEDFYGE